MKNVLKICALFVMAVLLGSCKKDAKQEERPAGNHFIVNGTSYEFSIVRNVNDSAPGHIWFEIKSEFEFHLADINLDWDMTDKTIDLTKADPNSGIEGKSCYHVLLTIGEYYQEINGDSTTSEFRTADKGYLAVNVLDAEEFSIDLFAEFQGRKVDFYYSGYVERREY